MILEKSDQVLPEVLEDFHSAYIECFVDFLSPEWSAGETQVATVAGMMTEN